MATKKRSSRARRATTTAVLPKMLPGLRIDGRKVARLNDVKILQIEIGTAARTWWESNPATLTVPPRHKFWWVTTRGTWVWHGGIGQSPPEGNGTADPHFVFKAPYQGGGLTGYARVNNQVAWACMYLPKYDFSRGENGKFYAYVNDNDYYLTYKFFCNDHDDEDMYADNSGVIVHTMAVAPI